MTASSGSADVEIRPRVDADLDTLVTMAEEVRRRDGYPGPGTDLATFLVSSEALGAWVATIDDAIVGHVALHPRSLPVVMERAAAVAEPPFGVVARLLSSPTVRRRGVGRALLDCAADEARRRGLRPILDVVTAYVPAIALYESAGWMNAGEVTMAFRDGTVLQSLVFVAPT
jgi:GNAT superfamily N-acetyltransferase